jgi:diaminohydroxyphosphoribosylaminopyrimidine deaminase/5-amino-6-(5-phosphoribosylamino)uracil reductase
MDSATQNVEVAPRAQQIAEDERLMSRALDLAAQGIGQVSPSPLVGCVIVDREGIIVGEGYYLYDRGTHAEALALEQAGNRAQGGTAYVTLEPHAHHGRTPPCTDALIAAGIARVVYALDDPNPLVAGRGGRALRDAGIEVAVGTLAQTAARQNEVYLHTYSAHRPFVHLKLACSLDGKIAARKGTSQWLTGPESRARVHELRHQSDAILIGANTARIDDPMLTDRSGSPRRRPLARVVMGHRANLEPDSKLLNSVASGPVLVYTVAAIGPEPQHDGVTFVPATGTRIDPEAVLSNLFTRGIQSVLIEGGPTIAASFLAAGLVDKVTIFLAPVLIGGEPDAPLVMGGNGLLGSDVVLHEIHTARYGDDIEVSGYPRQFQAMTQSPDGSITQ